MIQKEKDITLVACQTKGKETKEIRSKSRPKLELEDDSKSDKDEEELTSKIVNLVRKMIKKKKNFTKKDIKKVIQNKSKQVVRSKIVDQRQR